MALRQYITLKPDPVILARELGVPWPRVGLRLGVTQDWARRLSRDTNHTARVRTAVLELALEQERLREVLI